MRSACAKLAAACIVVGVAWPEASLAQPVLDLAQAYQLALRNDAAWAAARAAAAARRERVPQASALLMPNISASAARFRNDLESTQPGVGGVAVTADQNYTSSSRDLVIRQPLYRPFLVADLRQARAQVAQAEAVLQQERQNVAVRVSTAYFEALGAEDQLRLVLAQKTAFETQLDAARKRFSGGAGTRTDIDEAQARVDMAIAQELEAKQNVGHTRQQLEAVVGTSVGRLAPVDVDRLPLAPPSPASADAWIARAEEGSPEIRALRSRVEATAQEIEKAKAGHLPTLDTVAQVSVSNSDNITRVDTRYRHKAIGLQLNVPLFAGGYVNSRVRQALAEHEQAQDTLDAVRRDLGLRVNQEYRGVTEGVLRVRALEQAVRSAETVLNSTRRSFQAGARTQVDVLNAEERRAAAVRELANARYRYVLAAVRLRALAGEAELAAMEEANRWLSH